MTEIGGSENLNALVLFKGEEITRVAGDEVVGLSTNGGGKKFIVIGIGGGERGGKSGGGFGQFPQDEGDIEEEIAKTVFVAEVGAIKNI